MKIALAIALSAMCSFAFAATEATDAIDLQQTKPQNAQSQWGVEALKFPKQTYLHSAESLGLILPQSTNEKLSGINARYSNGKFSATTGVFSHSDNLAENSRFYLQGAYQLFQNERFDLAVTAKVEAVDQDTINNYYGQQDNLQAHASLFTAQATNTTIGLVSTYSISKKWKIQGVISSTSLDSKIENSPLLDSDSIHMALIKTSYAF
ncbi:hypothetical protein tinsulaeT_24900 [Thalassotalea insulae]|uniref:MipA/OmpV family protein n=1 Tax=Thalassotalea insulae TaxID=2056778 RepID=A0ABQ6GXB0_9GAMM|nr:MipA/OmpV family protein [Thalassotalea insulae]GLX79150.1 hypothetical protein tinsulaeT_24900 [Thalassotalea insulae]